MCGFGSFVQPLVGLVALALLSLPPLNAAVVQGTVVDDAGTAVSGATVKSLDLATGLEDSRVTGTDGKFTFGSAPGLTIDNANGVVQQGMFYLSAEKSPGYRNAVGAANGNAQPSDVPLVLTRNASVTGGAAFLGAVVLRRFGAEVILDGRALSRPEVPLLDDGAGHEVVVRPRQR